MALKLLEEHVYTHTQEPVQRDAQVYKTANPSRRWDQRGAERRQGNDSREHGAIRKPGMHEAEQTEADSGVSELGRCLLWAHISLAKSYGDAELSR